MAQRLKTDWILFGAVVAMVSFGLLMLYSASSDHGALDPRYGSSWHFVIRQLGGRCVAVAVMMTLKRTHYRKLQNPAVAFGAIGVASDAAGGGLLRGFGAPSVAAARGPSACSLRSWRSRRW